MMTLHKDFFSPYIRPPEMTRRVNELKEYIKEKLYEYARRFSLEILVIENAVTIPLNLPLGLAITEFIAETGFPTIAHHHDFFWERKRFLVNCVGDYLNMAFPPHLPSIRHVVINSIAAKEFSRRTGLSAMIIPNVMDFDESPPMSKVDFRLHAGPHVRRDCPVIVTLPCPEATPPPGVRLRSQYGEEWPSQVCEAVPGWCTPSRTSAVRSSSLRLILGSPREFRFRSWLYSVR